MIDFTIPPETLAFLDRLQAFVDEDVAPVEERIDESDFGDRDGKPSRVEVDVLPELRARARERGVYTPQLSEEFGGLDLGVTAMALVSERCGPHPLASYAIKCMAPDEATMAVSDPEAGPGRGISMFTVPTDADGFEVVRDLETMGTHGLGGHPEVTATGSGRAICGDALVATRELADGGA